MKKTRVHRRFRRRSPAFATGYSLEQANSDSRCTSLAVGLCTPSRPRPDSARRRRSSAGIRRVRYRRRRRLPTRAESPRRRRRATAF